jgi:hypothetical protein
MPSRQHSGTQAHHKTGKTRAATATAVLRGRGADMAVWFMRRLQCLLVANNSPCFTPKSPPTPEHWEYRQIIAETTCCARESVRMR